MWPKKDKKSQISVGLFYFCKKAKGVEKRAKNYKFGLKQAKLATLVTCRSTR